MNPEKAKCRLLSYFTIWSVLLALSNPQKAVAINLGGMIKALAETSNALNTETTPSPNSDPKSSDHSGNWNNDGSPLKSLIFTDSPTVSFIQSNLNASQVFISGSYIITKSKAVELHQDSFSIIDIVDQYQVPEWGGEGRKAHAIIYDVTSNLIPGITKIIQSQDTLFSDVRAGKKGTLGQTDGSRGSNISIFIESITKLSEIYFTGITASKNSQGVVSKAVSNINFGENTETVVSKIKEGNIFTINHKSDGHICCITKIGSRELYITFSFHPDGRLFQLRVSGNPEPLIKFTDNYVLNWSKKQRPSEVAKKILSNNTQVVENQNFNVNYLADLFFNGGEAARADYEFVQGNLLAKYFPRDGKVPVFQGSYSSQYLSRYIDKSILSEDAIFWAEIVADPTAWGNELKYHGQFNQTYFGPDIPDEQTKEKVYLGYRQAGVWFRFKVNYNPIYCQFYFERLMDFWSNAIEKDIDLIKRESGAADGLF